MSNDTFLTALVAHYLRSTPGHAASAREFARESAAALKKAAPVEQSLSSILEEYQRLLSQSRRDAQISELLSLDSESPLTSTIASLSTLLSDYSRARDRISADLNDTANPHKRIKIQPTPQRSDESMAAIAEARAALAACIDSPAPKSTYHPAPLNIQTQNIPIKPSVALPALSPSVRQSPRLRKSASISSPPAKRSIQAELQRSPSIDRITSPPVAPSSHSKMSTEQLVDNWGSMLALSSLEIPLHIDNQKFDTLLKASDWHAKLADLINQCMLPTETTTTTRQSPAKSKSKGRQKVKATRSVPTVSSTAMASLSDDVMQKIAESIYADPGAQKYLDQLFMPDPEYVVDASDDDVDASETLSPSAMQSAAVASTQSVANAEVDELDLSLLDDEKLLEEVLQAST